MSDSGSSSASVRRAASTGRSPSSGVDEGERARGAAEQRRARVVADAAEHVRVHVDRARQHQAAASRRSPRRRRARPRRPAAIRPSSISTSAADRRLGTDDARRRRSRCAGARSRCRRRRPASVGAALSSRRVYSCCGMLEHLCDGAGLDQRALIHHEHRVGHAGHDAEVVGDEEHAQARARAAAPAAARARRPARRRRARR